MRDKTLNPDESLIGLARWYSFRRGSLVFLPSLLSHYFFYPMENLENLLAGFVVERALMSLN